MLLVEQNADLALEIASEACIMELGKIRPLRPGKGAETTNGSGAPIWACSRGAVPLLDQARVMV